MNKEDQVKMLKKELERRRDDAIKEIIPILDKYRIEFIPSLTASEFGILPVLSWRERIPEKKAETKNRGDVPSILEA